jgi:hypothetical protein
VRTPTLVVLSLLAAAGCAARVAAPLPVGETVLMAQPAGTVARFVGSEACRGCHPSAYARWRATGHAREYAGLPAADRSDPACLRCHVTGYGDPLGLGGGAGELAAVGCEACHGAGADHALSAHPGLVPTVTGGECPRCEVNRICRLCHTPARSADFDLARSLELVACGARERR